MAMLKSVVPSVKINMTTETITPQLAEALLEHNKTNRKLRLHKVKEYADEMKAGRWDLNGETIIIDWNGNILDGQHRLWAAFEHQVAFESVVIRGVDPATYGSIDSGMKRSGGDVLQKRGLGSYSVLAAGVIRLVHFYETGRKDHNAVQRMPNSQTLALVEKYPRVIEAANLIGPRDVFKRAFGYTAIAGAAYFMLEVGERETREFLDAIATGENLKKKDPRLSARNFFLNSATRGVRLHQRVGFALYTKAWNAWIEGRDLQVLKYVEGEEHPEFAHRVKKAKR